MSRWFAVFGLSSVLMVSVSAAQDKTDNTAEIDRLMRRAASRSGRGDFEGALVDYAKVIELKPDFKDAYHQRGLVYSNQTRFADAVTDFDKVLELDAKAVEVCTDRGYAHYRLGNYADAIRDYDTYLAARPADQNGWNRRGLAREMTGHLNGAISDYGKAIELDPKLLPACGNRGDAYRKLGKTKESIADYSRVVDAEPNNAAYLNLRGLTRSIAGDLEGALADLTQALAVDSKLAAAYENRYVVLARLGKDAEAQKDWNSCLQLQPAQEQYLKSLQQSFIPIYRKFSEPKTATSFIDRGNALYGVNFNQQAASDYQRAIELGEFNPDPIYNLALALKASGYTLASADALRKCLEADDRYVLALYELGENLRYNQSRDADAIPYLKKAVEIKRDHLAGHASLGCALRDSGDLTASLPAFDRALELDPQYAFALSGRGVTHFRMGNYDKAIADLSKAVESNPKYSYALEFRGRAKTAKKDYAGAIADFDAALKEFNGAYTHMYRGLALVQAGRETEAKKDFDESLALYPRIKSELDAELAKLKGPARPK